MACLRVLSVLPVLVCLSAAPAVAQDPSPADPPAHVALVDGAAVLERDGRLDAEPASMPLLAGDRLRTQGGRVEVLFADGSALHLDAHTVVDFQSDDVVRLLEGRIRLGIAGPSRDVAYRVDTPSAWVQINDPGEYRIAVLRTGEVELSVLRGAAELVNEHGRSFIRAGERTFARADAAPSPAYVFNSAAWDDFDRWAEARRDRRLGVSAQHLPSDIRPYATAFDEYGDWRYEQTHGYVWYPRVQVGWRPYHRGRWVSLRPYGWTWIAGDPWGWPTHHYGRWGVSAGAWFWIPGRQWAPAWVSWAYAPGYVSWCPLGWNNRPVVQIVNVNFYGGRRYDPWHAWTVLPRAHFGRGYVNVTNRAILRLDQRTHNSFVVRDRAPEATHLFGRSVPIRSTGRYAVPRAGLADSTASDGSRGIDPGRRGPAVTRPRSSEGVDTDPGSVPARREGGRAVSRERGASVSPEVPRASGPADPSAGTQTREYRRSPGAAARERTGDSGSPITAAPGGAVRAMPRGRQPEASSPAPRSTPSAGTSEGAGEIDGPGGAGQGSSRMRRSEAPSQDYRSRPSPRTGESEGAPAAAPGGAVRAMPRVPQPEAPSGDPRSTPSAPPGPRQDRSRPYSPAPAYSAPPAQPSTPAPPRPAGEDRSSRAYPRGRSVPDGAPDSRERAAPRNDSPAAPPSYRSAPERRAPSDPPPAASAPPQRPSPGEGGAAGARERSRAGSSSGESRRRR